MCACLSVCVCARRAHTDLPQFPSRTTPPANFQAATALSATLAQAPADGEGVAGGEDASEQPLAAIWGALHGLRDSNRRAREACASACVRLVHSSAYAWKGAGGREGVGMECAVMESETCCGQIERKGFGVQSGEVELVAAVVDVIGSRSANPWTRVFVCGCGCVGARGCVCVCEPPDAPSANRWTFFERIQ